MFCDPRLYADVCVVGPEGPDGGLHTPRPPELQACVWSDQWSRAHASGGTAAPGVGELCATDTPRALLQHMARPRPLPLVVGLNSPSFCDARRSHFD